MSSSIQDSRELTLRRIASIIGKPFADEISRGSKLENWLADTVDVPLRELSLDDMCIIIRQQLFPEFTVMEALIRLDAEPLAGWQYDGELMFNLTRLPMTFWDSHVELAEHAALLALRATKFAQENDWWLLDEVSDAFNNFVAARSDEKAI